MVELLDDASRLPASAHLRWQQEDADFGVVLLADGISDKTLADVRLLIVQQFAHANGAGDYALAMNASHQRLCRGQFRFMVENVPLTEAQEGMLTLQRVGLRLTLLPGDDEPKQMHLDDVQRAIPVSTTQVQPRLQRVDSDWMSRSTEFSDEEDADEDRASSRHSDDEKTLLSNQMISGSHVVVPVGSLGSLDDTGELCIRIFLSGNDEHVVATMQKLLKKIDHLPSIGSGIVWIDIQGYSEDDVELLGAHMRLHPLTSEDITCGSTRQKVEGFAHYMFLALESLQGMSHSPTEQLQNNNVNVLIFDKMVITLHRRKEHALYLTTLRVRKVYASSLPSTAALVHAIVDCLIDADVPEVDSAVCEVDNLEDLVYMLSQYEQADLLKRMGLVRRRLTMLRQKLWPKRDILVNLMDKEWRKFIQGIRLAYFRDVYDHILVMLQKLEISSEMLSSLQSTYLAKVSIEVAEASNNLDEVMKKLSSIATILLPMTFVTGLFGMNVKVPFQTTEEDPSLGPFFGILAIMVFAAVPMYIILKRRDMV